MTTRNNAIDFMKGVLTVLMVLAHSIQFFVELDNAPAMRIISDYINLTTFSGFVFTFGYVSNFAYLTKAPRERARKLLLNIGRLLIAFYLSSLAFVIFREHADFSLGTVLNILLIRRLAGWSEFLLSFALLMLLCLLSAPAIRELSLVRFVAILALSLASTFIPFGSVNPIIGSVIGGTNYSYFPVLQYFGFFVVGVWFAQRGLFMIAGYFWCRLSAP